MFDHRHYLARWRDGFTRLEGKEFEAPRKPDLQTHQLVVAFKDWRYGAQKGLADARGYGMVDEQGVPHAEGVIDAQARRAVEDQRHGFQIPKESAAKVRWDAVEQQVDAGREVGVLAEQDMKLSVEEEAQGRRHGPSEVGYAVILSFPYLLSLPVDFAAAMWTPLPPAGQWLLAFLIGAVMLLAAHLAAVKIEDLREAHAQRAADSFSYRKEQFALGFALAAPLGVIVSTGIWRGGALAAEQQATGGLVHGGAANVAFALLALLAFVVAVLAGVSYRRMAPLREVRRARAKIAAQRKGWQQTLDQAERTERQAELTLAYLAKREQHVIEAIRHRAVERKARLRQRAANVEMRERRKQTKKGATPGPYRLMGGRQSNTTTKGP